MDTAFDARVVAAFGRHLIVRDRETRIHRARVFGRRLAVVCGDDVRCESDARTGEVHVVALLPRRATLFRANSRGYAEVVVANVTRLMVVIAPIPEPDFFLVDRYLSAAASASIDALLVVNKHDLGIGESLRTEIDTLAAAGYSAIECSARTGEGLDRLRDACGGAIAVLVGQSGTGKSSLLRQLVPDSDAVTGELMREEEGRHTTTASRLYDLASGGHLIDSPGVRDFAPALEALEPATLGFIEVARLAPQCRFLDCRHMREPGCAVRTAVDEGLLPARRYESYRRLRVLFESLTAARGPANRPRRPETGDR